MKKERLEVLELSKILHLEDIIKYPYLKQNLKIRFHQKFQENLWNKSKDKINCVGIINKWDKLSKSLKVNINSIIRFNERSTAKPIEIYEKLLNLLEYNITWVDLEKNILNLVLVKNKLKVKFPLKVADLGLTKSEPIKINVPKIKWEVLNKNPITTFKLKDFIKKIEIKTPYFNSKNKKHDIFKRIGKKYKIDLTKKIYIHLNNEDYNKRYERFINDRL